MSEKSPKPRLIKFEIIGEEIVEMFFDAAKFLTSSESVLDASMKAEYFNEREGTIKEILEGTRIRAQSLNKNSFELYDTSFGGVKQGNVRFVEAPFYSLDVRFGELKIGNENRFCKIQVVKPETLEICASLVVIKH